MTTLYPLKMDYLNVIEMAREPGIDPQTIANTLESIEDEAAVKIDSMIVAIKEVEAYKEMLEKEILRLTENRTTASNVIDRMKREIFDMVSLTTDKKIVTEHYRTSVVKNGGATPMYVSPDISDIPEEYLTVKKVPNNDKIRESLENGEKLQWAHLKERGEHLLIK